MADNMSIEIQDVKEESVATIKEKTPQIIVGTPDHIKLLSEKWNQFNSVKTVVMDDLDTSIGMGYHFEMEDLLSLLPSQLQYVATINSINPIVDYMFKKYFKTFDYLKDNNKVRKIIIIKNSKKLKK